MKETHKRNGVSVGNKNPNFGKKASIEKIEKCINSLVKSGRIYNFYQIDKDLNYILLSNIKKYCKENNWNSKGINLCFNDTIKSYKGYAFCRENDLEERLNIIKNDDKYWTKCKRDNKVIPKLKIILKNLITLEIKEFISILQASIFIGYSWYTLKKLLDSNESIIGNFEIISFEKLNKI